ncbi:olfactory receptor 14A16-like [Ara ararauna]
MSNSSSITQFPLLPFADARELQLWHFWLFLSISLAALMDNGLIITSTACDQHLHTPRYFFLLNLSLLDLGCISTPDPKSMANSLWGTRAFSYTGWVAQLFVFLFLISAEYSLLTIMSWDHYVAICKPLHYGARQGSSACVHMAAAAWGTGFLTALLHTANTFSLPLCGGNAVEQLFCEIPHILKLSCSHSYLREVGLLLLRFCMALGCFVFIVGCYVQIFRAVLRIPSEQGRHKAFSTCLPHLAVVSVFIPTAVFAYMKPPCISSPSLDLVVSVLYSVVPSAVNPLIYSLRNQELMDAVRKQMTACVSAAIRCLFSSAKGSQCQ